ncbi:MAG: DEAD/DEAH box helicase [Cellulosilyticum sp.]|nr:DEAD/DEAH box helicase [Cellulosilyticum sp.]
MEHKLVDIGMYVRCPFDNESKEFPRVFITGQITFIDTEEGMVGVKFHDLDGLKRYIEDLPMECEVSIESIERCEIRVETEVKYVLPGSLTIRMGHIIWKARQLEEGYYVYYISDHNQPKNIHKVREDRINAALDTGVIKPWQQMLNYEFQNPRWYLKRTLVSRFVSALANAPQGFKELVGARAYLFPHQIDTIMRASKEEHCRLMLADEVGLGKTIEALIIADTLQKSKKHFKTLIIVPKALMNQWKNEFEIKLWIEAHIYDGSYANDYNHIILPLEEISDPAYSRVLAQGWDLLIVDEVHNILGMGDVYNMIYSLSEKTEHVLLLSATPITVRRVEYLNLLKLLKPEQYGQMREETFEGLVERNKIIKENVCRCREYLEEFYQDGEEDTGYLEDVKEALTEINEETDDQLLGLLIGKIESEDVERSLDFIHKALTYIAEYYQIDRDIIRHRRSELNQNFAQRKLIKCKYEMADSTRDYYEYETYMELLGCIEALTAKGDCYATQIKELFNAMFSSPFALEEVIYHYKLNEAVDMKNLIKNLEHFKKATEKAIIGIKEDVENLEILGRFTLVANYIDQELYDQKIVVFSKYTKTAEAMYRLLSNLYKEMPIMRFYKGLSHEELMENMNAFQNDPGVNILVCDYLAGEGRNLQGADCIVHIDLPISPNDIEQRIGRLDRIGRKEDKDVVSIVFVAEGTVEDKLLRIWDEALNIFGESLSGLEIALKELQDTILEYMCHSEDIYFESFLEEFKTKVNKLKEALEEERYNDANRQMSKRFQLLIEDLIMQVDEGEGSALATVMKSWGGMVGLKDESVYSENGQSLIKYTRNSFSQGSFRKAWYIPPSTEEILKRANKAHQIQGTFSRNQAIMNENIAFFAPGEPIFDSLLKHGMNSYQGTCCAIQVEGDVDFTGFIVNWKTSFNMEPLLEEGVNLSALSYIKAYDINKVESEVFRLAGEALNSEDIEAYLDVPKGKYIHLGQRHGGAIANIIKFMNWYDADSWKLRVKKAIKETKQLARERADERIERCITAFKRNYAMEQKAIYTANAYYEKEIGIEDKKVIGNILLKGIKNYKLEVDSIVFVKVVNRNGY